MGPTNGTFFRRHQFFIVVNDDVDSTNGAMMGCRKTFRVTTGDIIYIYISNDDIIDGAKAFNNIICILFIKNVILNSATHLHTSASYLKEANLR